MVVKYCSSGIVVRDMLRARQFYEKLLEQTVEFDHGECVSFVGGFALWQIDHASRIIFGKEDMLKYDGKEHAGEMYFETEEMEETCARLSRAGVKFIHEMMEQPWGQRVFRVYDPDGHIVEIGEPIPGVIKRYLKQGMSPEDVALRTSMPLAIVNMVAESGAGKE